MIYASFQDYRRTQPARRSEVWHGSSRQHRVSIYRRKAIAALVRLGLENQESRKREFFSRLRENLANDDPELQDRLVDEFRALIHGR